MNCSDEHMGGSRARRNSRLSLSPAATRENFPPMKKTTRILTVSLVLLAGGAIKPSAKPPTEEPIQPEVQREVDRYAKADKELNRFYRHLMSTLTKDKQEQLKKAQRAWIAFRDAEADLEADGAGWGWPASWNASLARLTEARTKQLKEAGTW